MATQIMSRIRERFAVELTVRTLFEAPTVAGLAGALVERRGAQVDADTLGELVAEIKDLSDEEVEAQLEREKERGPDA